jgi:hypothetical protein
MRDHGIVEIDWTSSEAGRISVNRSEVVLSEKAKKAREWLDKVVEEQIASLANANKTMPLSSVNFRVANLPDLSSGGPSWVHTENKISAWCRIRFPAISRVVYEYQDDYPKVALNGEPVQVIECLSGYDADDEYSGLGWNSVTTAPDKIILVEERRLRIAPLWTKKPSIADTKGQSPIGLLSRFPPQWKNVCGIYFDAYASIDDSAHVWNGDHPLAHQVTSEARQWISKELAIDKDALRLKDQLLRSRSRLAAWLLHCMTADQEEYWNAVKERDSEFLKAVWKVIFNESSRFTPVIYIREVEPRVEVYLISPGGWSQVTQISRYIKPPGKLWTLQKQKASK